MFDRRGHNRPPFPPTIPGTGLRSPEVPAAIIYRPARSPMQSGPRPRDWIVEFEPAQPAEIEPLMGWTATRDPYRPIRLRFADRESAVDFAERQDWSYVLLEEGQRRAAGAVVLRPRRHPDGQVAGVTATGETDETDPVVLASLESFPASDPPAWTGATIAAR
ncbi:MAG: ETC complex I subunit [Defluviimonas sp.]|nr:ETC complex I subunit [Defluviimonas sp.]